jgi:hypothetical protein
MSHATAKTAGRARTVARAHSGGVGTLLVKSARLADPARIPR